METGLFQAFFLSGLVGLAISSGLLVLTRRMKPGGWRRAAAIPLAIVTGFGAFYGFAVTLIYLFGLIDAEAIIIGVIGGVFFLSLFLNLGLRGGPGDQRASDQRTDPPKRAPAPKAPPSPRGTPDVFISYKREERREVGDLARRLEALGLNVWFDAELRSGTSFDAEINRNVRAAKCVLVCWSPGAVESEWVRGEATIGHQRGVLAAAFLKPCDLPAPFNLVHTEDLVPGIGPSNAAWLRLLDRIGGLLERPGLAGFEQFSESGDRAAIATWLADHSSDPLFDRAVAMLKSA